MTIPEAAVTERDELARILYIKAEWHWPNPLERWDQELPEYRESYACMADTVLAAGYTRTTK